MKIPTCNSQNLLSSSFIYCLATTIYLSYLILYYWLQYIGEEIGARRSRFVEVNSLLGNLLAMIYRLIKNALFPMHQPKQTRDFFNLALHNSCWLCIVFNLPTKHDLFLLGNELNDCVNHLFCGSLGQLRRQRDFFIVFL